MEDIILLEYLKSKGMINNDIYNKMLMKSSTPNVEVTTIGHSKAEKYSEFLESFKEVTKDMEEEEKHLFIDKLKDYKDIKGGHYNEPYAKYIVSNMWHTDSNRKYTGEKFDIHKAKEVHERYRNVLDNSVTYSDIYVAINEHYHNYHCLFKSWFGENMEHQLIEAAMVYWFKDEDYTGSLKVLEHLKEN